MCCPCTQRIKSDCKTVDEIGHAHFNILLPHPTLPLRYIIYIAHACKLYHTALGSSFKMRKCSTEYTCSSVMVTASTPSMFYYCWLLHINYATCNNYGYLHSCSPGGPFGCEAPPTLATGVTGKYNDTTVSSVIVYQCQQSGFIPSISAPSSVCGYDGRWSPDPSQVVCVELPGLLLRFPATTVEL